VGVGKSWRRGSCNLSPLGYLLVRRGGGDGKAFPKLIECANFGKKVF